MEQKLKSLADELRKMERSIKDSLEIDQLNRIRRGASDVVAAAGSLRDKIIRLRVERQ